MKTSEKLQHEIELHHDGEASEQLRRPAPVAAPSDNGSIDHPAGETPKRPLYKRPIVMSVLGLIALVAAAVGVRYYLYARAHESTDDAFVEGHIVQMSPKVSGYVAQVAIDDNQHVTRGQLLVQIDRRDYEAKLAEEQANLQAAQSRLAEAQTNLDVLKANVAAAKADVTAAEANAEYARAQAKRYGEIVPSAASATERENAIAAAKTADANGIAARSKVAAAEAQRANGASAVSTAEAQVAVAQTKVRQAELDLSYTTIVAPETGRITRKNVEPGAYIQPGQALLAVVPDDVWVLANFKETQLTHMQPGQPVEIDIDAYPDKTFRGHVDSIQSGTGARFSMLPPENATGNYVKVVQRVPVKIVFDEKPGEQLVVAPGMSVVPEVKVR
jgi:membrane fusion protein (multidrug efflux system)